MLAKAMWDVRASFGFDTDGDDRYHGLKATEIASAFRRDMAKALDAEIDLVQEVEDLRERLQTLLGWLERNKHLEDPLSVLEKFDLPTADHQGYLAGLNSAAARLRFVLEQKR